MNVEQNPRLMVRKPISVADIKKQIDRTLELEDIGHLVGQSNIVTLQLHSWETLMMAHLGGLQWWLVNLIKEDLLLLIDTQGYDYPRYVGILSDDARQKLNPFQTKRDKHAT